MNDEFDPVVDAVLRQASAAVEPGPARLARALRAVQEQVAFGGEPELDSANEGALQRAGTAPAPVGKAGIGPVLTLLRTPAAFLAWGAVSAAIGFLFGMRYEHAAIPALAPPAVVATLAAGGGATPPAPLPSVVVPAERVSAKEAPAPRAAVVGEAPRARGSKARAAPPREAFGFREALDYVRRAERAERQGDPALALALLAELDERADANTLREERALTRVLALCAQGEREAALRAQRELGAAKESIYAKRIAQSCVSETRSR